MKQKRPGIRFLTKQSVLYDNVVTSSTLYLLEALSFSLTMPFYVQIYRKKANCNICNVNNE